MTIKQESSAPKFSKNDRRLKRDEATRMAKVMLQSTQSANEFIGEFSKLIDELDSCKDPNSRKGPKDKPISSIFDLEILRDKKYLLEKWVSQYKESLTKTQPKVESSSMTAA